MDRLRVQIVSIIALLALAACASHEIKPVIPYAAWPRVAQIKKELDRGPPQWLLECPDRRDLSMTATGACVGGWQRYHARRAKLQAEFVCWTNPNYTDADDCKSLGPDYLEITTSWSTSDP